MTDQFPADPPSPFLARVIGAVTPVPGVSSVLDLAMGRGRHAVPLAGLGWRVFGVDANFEAVRAANARAAAGGLTLRSWCADLTQSPLPRHRFDLLLVTRYLQRDLFAAIRGAVVPGGIVAYETFTTRQRALGRGPTSSEHLLDPGELRGRFDGFEIMFYEEVTEPEAVARILVRSVRL